MSDEDKVIFTNEAELLKWFVRWLVDNGWTVYQEVATPNGYCDIVATKIIDGEEVRWGIEGKMQMNDEVIIQASHNRPYFDFVSIAVPKPPSVVQNFYLEHHGIGVLSVRTLNWTTVKYKRSMHWDQTRYAEDCYPLEGIPFDQYEFLQAWPATRQKAPKKSAIRLHELYQNSTAGTTGIARVTNYKVTVKLVWDHLNKIGDWVEFGELVKALEDQVHWGNPRAGMRKMILEWESHRFYTEKKLDKKMYVKSSHVFD